MVGNSELDKLDDDDSHRIKQNKVKVNGVELKYDLVGSGRNVLLLLPGVLGCSYTDFRHQMRGLNTDMFTIVAVDPRGYGGSVPPERDWPAEYHERDADDAAQLMQSIGVEKYSVLGWGDGGVSAMTLAAGYPDRLHKLVVWGASAYVTDDELLTYAEIRDVSAWKKSVLGNYLQVYDEDYLQRQVDGWLDALTACRQKRDGDICGDVLDKIDCPTLILHGVDDKLVPRHHADHLARNIKHSSLELFPTGKHNIHQQQHYLFNSLVQHFLIQPIES